MQVKAREKKAWPFGKLLRLVISVVLIAGIVWWLGGLGKIVAIIGGISLGWTALVVILITLDRALTTFKWGLLLKARRTPIRFLPAMKIYCASMIWGMFLPMTVGSDTIRAVSTARTGINTNEVVASIVIERVFGFLSALLVGLFSLLLLSLSGELEGRVAVIWWAALITVGSSLIALATSLSERMFHLIHNRILGRFHNNRIVANLRKFHETYMAYRKHAGTLVTFSILTIAEQLAPVAVLWFVAFDLGIHRGIIAFAIAFPLSILVTRLPIGIAGLGTFEVTFAFFLSLFGIPTVDAVAIAFTGRILEIVTLLPWWFAQVISSGGLRQTTDTMRSRGVTAQITS